MIYNFSKRVISSLYHEKSKQEQELYVYGFEILLRGILSAFLILLISFFMDAFRECVIFLILFMTIRIYIGVYHANTCIKCNLIFSFIFIMSVKFLPYIRKMSIEIYFWITVLVMEMMIYRYAPLEHKNKHLTLYQQKKYKLVGGVLYLICILVSFIIHFIEQYFLKETKERIVFAEASNYINLVLVIIGMLFIAGMKRER